MAPVLSSAEAELIGFRRTNFVPSELSFHLHRDVLVLPQRHLDRRLCTSASNPRRGSPAHLWLCCIFYGRPLNSEHTEPRETGGFKGPRVDPRVVKGYPSGLRRCGARCKDKQTVVMNQARLPSLTEIVVIYPISTIHNITTRRWKSTPIITEQGFQILEEVSTFFEYNMWLIHAHYLVSFKTFHPISHSRLLRKVEQRAEWKKNVIRVFITREFDTDL